jgi:hypothetical protein
MIKSTQPLEIQTWLAKFATPGVQRYLVISEASLVQKAIQSAIPARTMLLLGKR